MQYYSHSSRITKWGKLFGERAIVNQICCAFNVYTLKYKSKNENASKRIVKMELTALKGSEKQIAWAEKIRAKKIEAISEILDQNFQLVSDKNKAVDYLRSKSSAKFWIENRDASWGLAMYVLRETEQHTWTKTASVPYKIDLISKTNGVETERQELHYEVNCAKFNTSLSSEHLSKIFLLLNVETGKIRFSFEPALENETRYRIGSIQGGLLAGEPVKFLAARNCAGKLEMQAIREVW